LSLFSLKVYSNHYLLHVRCLFRFHAWLNIKHNISTEGSCGFINYMIVFPYLLFSQCWYTVRLSDEQGIQVETVMVFNATFNNISVVSWWSVLQVYYVCHSRTLLYLSDDLPVFNNIFSCTLQVDENGSPTCRMSLKKRVQVKL
jgi:hypothetical protein